MRKSNTRTMAALSLAGSILFSSNLFAQAIEVTQTVVTVPKKVIVEQNMVFDNSDQSAAFWAVYEEYQIDMDQINYRLGELISAYAMKYRTMTDEEAGNMLDTYLELEGERLAMRKTYLPKFKEILSSKQVARLYQVENKLEAITRFGLVDAIPLMDIAQSKADSEGGAA